MRKGTKKLHLTKGYYAIVDAVDWERLSRHKWSASVNHVRKDGTALVYGVRGYYVAGKYKRLYLHLQILKAPTGMVVDHIDGNPLNNSRTNLRIVSISGNARNRVGSRDK